MYQSASTQYDNSRLEHFDKANEFTRTHMRLAEDIRQQSAEIASKREIL